VVQASRFELLLLNTAAAKSIGLMIPHGERFPLFAFHPSRAHPPAKVRAFIDFCIEAAREI
jgi:hypothetical protein